jgi:hypothetical protein
MGCALGGSRSLFYVMKILIVLVASIAFSSPMTYIVAGSHSSEEATEIYFYRVVVETNSDWTTIGFSNGPMVIGYNYTLILGSEAPNLKYVVEPTYIWICKKPYDRTLVSINISIIALKGNEQESIVIKKGDIGSTNVSMYVWIGGGFRHLWSVSNNGTNPQYPGTNDRSFTVDFKQLYEHPAASGLYEDIDLELKEHVLAFYYPWYGVTYGASRRWFHWENASCSSIANAAHYPLLGVYDSWDERVIETHIILAKHSGVEGFIVSWWGPGSFEDQSLKRIIKVAEKYNFKITIYYESYRPWSPLVSPTNIVNELSYVVKEYSTSPSFLKINGKPVIFIYAVEAHNRGPSFWLQVRKGLENSVGPVYLIGELRSPSYLYVFDGFHTYIELNSSVMRELYLFYDSRMRLGLTGLSFDEAVAKILSGGEVVVQRKALFYTLIPGYDDRKIRSPGKYVDRDVGFFYQKMWSDALELGARHILITSWNELHEGTEIEPTREYGFKYIEITRSYANKLKQVGIGDIPPPSLSINTSSYGLGDELHIELSNSGGGPAIAVRVEATPLRGVAFFTSPYRQPCEPSRAVAVVPLIRSGEAHQLTIKLREASETMSNIVKLSIWYYPLNGSLYSTEILVAIHRITSTITETATKTVTTIETSTITKTKEITTTATQTKAVERVYTITVKESLTITQERTTTATQLTTKTSTLTETLTQYTTTTTTKQVTQLDWFTTLSTATIMLITGLALGAALLHRPQRQS